MNSDRSMRGTRLGAQSLENEYSVIPAARMMVRFQCPADHEFSLPMAVGADVPALWPCRCGEQALRESAEQPEAPAPKPVRTHWDMLLERRSVAELEVILAERLEVLRRTTFGAALRKTA